jgi:SAM-dependent methyltransferase
MGRGLVVRALADLAADPLIQGQIGYYQRMGETGQYDRAYARSGRYDRGEENGRTWHAELAVVAERIHEFAPRGSVLEPACGPGRWSGHLLRSADRLTTVDASEAMLDLHRQRVPDPRVRRVCANVFDWEPQERFDAVFLGLWLSHVPADYLAAFLQRVHSWLVPDGWLFLFDSLWAPTRTATDEELVATSPGRIVRKLDSGEEFPIVKVFYEPDELSGRLAEYGWTAHIEATGPYFYTGTARPPGSSTSPSPG